MEKRTLQELNLLDDFLFGKMVTYPGIGERFCKQLLSIILDVELAQIKIVPQKVYLGADTNLHGARLDVYIEEEGKELNGTLFDMEPDKNDKKALKKALPQRVRFYHAMIDQECLKSRQRYDALKRVIVILMTPYDPFGYGHMVYTIKNHCEEIPDMPYDDGAKTLFLYTRGKKGNASQKLQELLRYLEETTKDNACNEMLTDIHKMVTKVKSDEEVSLEYMKIFEREKMIYEAGREDGFKDGETVGFKNGQIVGYGNGFGDGLEKGIVALIVDNLAFHVPIDQINVKLQKNFELTETKAQEYIKKYLDAVSVSDEDVLSTSV